MLWKKYFTVYPRHKTMWKDFSEFCLKTKVGGNTILRNLDRNLDLLNLEQSVTDRLLFSTKNLEVFLIWE